MLGFPGDFFFSFLKTISHNLLSFILGHELYFSQLEYQFKPLQVLWRREKKVGKIEGPRLTNFEETIIPYL